ncbi:MAG: GNAT family N-acetyltransferase [Nanoarchaeota archaeon]
MLSFVDITLKNWNKYEENILNSELEFKEEIRTPKEEYIYILRSKSFIFKVVLLDNVYIGLVTGYKPAKADIRFHGLKNKTNDFIYLFNIVIDKPYQGKGYGSALLDEFLRASKEKGFSKLIGHFGPNSKKLMIRHGATEISVAKNWENTGDDFFVYELNI